jgi:WG repeat protein
MRVILVFWLRVASLSIFIPVCSTAQSVPQLSPPESGSPQLLIPIKASNGKWGYVDKNGSYAIRPQFAHAESFQEGLALVQTTWGVNLMGKTEGVYLFGRVGYIDVSGKFVIGPRFAENARGFSEGVAAFKPGASSWGNAKWGYLDKHGKWAIKPRFEIAGDFSEDLAPVQVSQGKDAAGKEMEPKWGYIDHAGRFVIPPQFYGAMPFKNGIAIVRTQPPPGYRIHPTRCIDKQGKFIAQCPHA